MKKILLHIVLVFCTFFSLNAQTNYAEVYATKIAGKMKDSLSLSETQKTQIYNISIQLSNQKSNVWQQYTGSDSLISLHVQRIENTRDSLYRPVLGETKFVLYMQKKRNLLNNN